MSSSSKTPAVVNLDRIRSAQAQRIEHSLASWEHAKEQLRAAIALVETREREFHDVSADVEAKLAAVDTVLSLAGVEPALKESSAAIRRPSLLAAPAVEPESDPQPETAAEPGFRELFSRSRSLVPQENRAALVAAVATA